MIFVLDASSALSWCFADETTEASIALLAGMRRGNRAIVPAHWPAEMLSALLQGKRRNRITEALLLTALRELAFLQIHVDRNVTTQQLLEIKELSERFQLNAYDAIYLALAMREDLPLATNDAALQRACIAQGIPLI